MSAKRWFTATRAQLTFARPLVNLLAGIRLPRAGSVLAHAFLSPLAFVEGCEALLQDFVAAFFPLAAQTGVEFLTLALPASDTRLPALCRRFSTRTWRSRLYRVSWPDDLSIELDATAFLPDVALL